MGGKEWDGIYSLHVVNELMRLHTACFSSAIISDCYLASVAADAIIGVIGVIVSR